jgi:hypothetical protein
LISIFSPFIDFETKFLDKEKNWVTGNINKLDESFLDDDIIEKEKLEYIGITSARVKVDIMGNAYKKMLTDKDIYLADFSDSIIRIDKKDYKKELKIQVPDLAWEIDFINQ